VKPNGTPAVQGMRWGGGQVATSHNGAVSNSVSTDDANALGTAAYIGGALGGVAVMGGPIARITVYDTALSDAQLAAADMTTDLLAGEETYLGTNLSKQVFSEKDNSSTGDPTKISEVGSNHIITVDTLGYDIYRDIGIPKEYISESDMNTIKEIDLPKNIGVSGIVSFLKNINITKIISGFGTFIKTVSFNKDIAINSSTTVDIVRDLTLSKVFDVSGYPTKINNFIKELSYISLANISFTKSVITTIGFGAIAVIDMLKSLYYNLYHTALGSQTTLLLLLLDVINIAATGTIHIFIDIFTDVFVIQMAMLIALIRRRNSL